MKFEQADAFTPKDKAGSPDKEMEERIFLAQNMAQFAFANLDYRNLHPGVADISESELDGKALEYGLEFQSWYMSENGKAALANYVKYHDENDIVNRKDIDVLIRSFLYFRNHQGE